MKKVISAVLAVVVLSASAQTVGTRPQNVDEGIVNIWKGMGYLGKKCVEKCAEKGSQNAFVPTYMQRVSKALDKAALEVSKSTQESEDEASHAFVLAKDIRTKIAHAKSAYEIEHLKVSNDPKDQDGALVNYIGQQYLLIKEANLSDAVRFEVMKYLGAPIKVRFQQEDYVFPFGTYNQWASGK